MLWNPTSKLTAKHLLTRCFNDRRLLQLEIDEVQLRCLCWVEPDRQPSTNAPFTSAGSDTKVELKEQDKYQNVEKYQNVNFQGSQDMFEWAFVHLVF